MSATNGPSATVHSPSDGAPVAGSMGELDGWRRRKFTRVKRAVRQVVDAEDRRHAAVRRRLSAQHLEGTGLEIGALHLPLHVSSRAHVRYVDRADVAGLRAHYPELDDFDLVSPDVIDDGETLASVADRSVDFVIANHFIEHCEDPIGTIANHLRVLRSEGVLYMAVPNRLHTFDRERAITPLDHLQRDHREGPAWSRRGHYVEWARFVEAVPPDAVAARAEELDRSNYSIHYHVWSPSAFVELISHCRAKIGLPLEIEALERTGSEFIVILRRTADVPEVASGT